jgi:hypothetical protein
MTLSGRAGDARDTIALARRGTIVHFSMEEGAMHSALKGTTRMLAGAAIAVSLLFTAACDDDDDPFVPVPTELTLTSGNNQTLAVSTASAPLTVTLLDQNDDPVAGRTVNWTVATGTGTLTSATSVTNAEGVATMTFTSATTVGAATVTATVTGVSPVTFNLMVE